MHQRKPIVTDTRSKKISNTLQVNEADSFGIKPTPHWKYNKVSSKGKNSLQPNLPSHLPINRIKFRVFILFQILIKTNKRVPRQKTPTSENHLHLHSFHSTSCRRKYISRQEIQLYQTIACFLLDTSSRTWWHLRAFWWPALPRAKNLAARLRHF